MRSFLRIGALAAPFLLLAACGPNTTALGDANSIIFVAPDSIWEEAGTTVQQILEPRILTVRDERTFDLTPVAPGDPALERLRYWRQVLVVGQATDPWVSVVLGEANTLPETLPAIVERDNIWARGQRVTAVVLPPDGGAAELVEILPELHQLLDQRFRAYAQARMFVSGRNDSLRAALQEEAGFGLLLPTVYTVDQPAPDSYLFRNDNMVGGELVRVIQVTWRPGVDPTLTHEEILEWRDRVSARNTRPVQHRQPELLETALLEGYDPPALEARGAWEADIDGYPMAGPYITRAIACPAQDRTYLLDAWLYAPGMDKYEYMLQLETILNTFECGTH